MKKWLCAFLALFLLLSPAAAADYDAAQDYLDILFRAACCGDLDAGRAAAVCYNEGLADRQSLARRIDFDELLWLAKIITHEAGSSGIGIEWRMCVGEVVLNRVASPEFPGTVEEVIFQPGQYAGVDCAAFRELLDPDELSVEAALRLLQGDRLMEPSVVFQSNFRQGGGEYLHFYSEVFGYTFFCVSSHPELYA